MFERKYEISNDTKESEFGIKFIGTTKKNSVS